MRIVRPLILCTVHSIWFVKYVFSAKIWSVKTSIRIVKYESRARVAKSNPGLPWIIDMILILYREQLLKCIVKISYSKAKLLGKSSRMESFVNKVADSRSFYLGSIMKNYSPVYQLAVSWRTTESDRLTYLNFSSGGLTEKTSCNY